MKLSHLGRTGHLSTLTLTRLRARKLVRTLTEDSERLVTASDLRELRA